MFDCKVQLDGSQEEETASVQPMPGDMQTPKPSMPPTPPLTPCMTCSAPPSVIFDQVYKICGPLVVRPNLLSPAFVNFRQAQLLASMYQMAMNSSMSCQECGVRRNFVREINTLYCYLADYVLNSLIPGYNRPGILFS